LLILLKEQYHEIFNFGFIFHESVSLLLLLDRCKYQVTGSGFLDFPDPPTKLDYRKRRTGAGFPDVLGPHTRLGYKYQEIAVDLGFPDPPTGLA
jgi:hypothetical protein